MPKKLEGRVESVLVGADSKTKLSSRQEEVKVTLDGFEGDRHSGPTMRSNARQPWYPRGTIIRNSRQISIVSVEELAQVAEAMELPELLPEWYGANLNLQGIPNLTLLPPSTRLFFPGEAVLVIDGENTPCTVTGRMIQAQFPDRSGLTSAFPKAAMHKRGVVAWVERPGIIKAGDPVEVQLVAQIAYSFK
jgi:hypothetical protein